eukprot:tig00000411_g514.t1
MAEEWPGSFAAGADELEARRPRPRSSARRLRAPLRASFARIAFLRTPGGAARIAFLRTPGGAARTSFLRTPRGAARIAFLRTPGGAARISFLRSPRGAVSSSPAAGAALEGTGSAP